MSRPLVPSLALALAVLLAGCAAPDGPAPPLDGNGTPSPTPGGEPDDGGRFTATRTVSADAGAERGLFLGDVDGDGLAEVLVPTASAEGGVAVFRPGAPGSLGPVEDAGLACEGCAVTAVAVGDVDHDGVADAYVAAAGGNGVLLLGNATTGFRAVNGSGIEGVGGASGAFFTELDNDGRTDLVVVARDGPPSWFRGLGDGTFAPGGALGNRTADFVVPVFVDDDALLDLVVSGPEGLSLLRNGNGTFEAAPIGRDVPSWAVRSAFAADLDNDQAIDLVVATDSGVHVLRNTLRGGFRDATEDLGVPAVGGARAVVASDFDNDGWRDLLVLDDGGSVRLLRSEQGRTFTPVEGADGLPWGPYHAVAVLDLDGDGLQDAVLQGEDGSLTTLRNRGQAGHHFRLVLQGNESTTPGYATKTALSSATFIQFHQVGGSAGGVASEAIVPHFGLGAEPVEQYTLAIKWPSGILQFENVEAARIVDKTLPARESVSEAPWDGC